MIVRELDDFLAVLVDESGRQHQQIGADGIERVGEPFRLQTQPLEPVHQIQRQQHQLKERHVGSPGIGGDFAQGLMPLAKVIELA